MLVLVLGRRGQRRTVLLLLGLLLLLLLQERLEAARRTALAPVRKPGAQGVARQPCHRLEPVVLGRGRVRVGCAAYGSVERVWFLFRLRGGTVGGRKTRGLSGGGGGGGGCGASGFELPSRPFDKKLSQRDRCSPR